MYVPYDFIENIQQQSKTPWLHPKKRQVSQSESVK